MARSKDQWQRRSAIVSTYAFIKKGELQDTFQIAEILVHDKEELVNKAVGSWLREAGKKDQAQLKKFLEKYAKTMPRFALRNAIEKLSKAEREYYMKLSKK